MKRVLTAVVLVPIVILALFKAPLWLFTLLVLGVALLAAREYLDIAAATGFKPFRALGYFFLVCTFVACGTFVSLSRDPQISVSALTASSTLAVLSFLAVLVSPFVFVVASMQRDPLCTAMGDASVSFFMLPYVGFTLFGLPMLRSYRSGAIFILFIMLLVWAGDIAAYYVGRALGKHKLAPRVSPAKTWEGSVASVIAAVVVAIVLFQFLPAMWRGLHGLHLVSVPGHAEYSGSLADAKPSFDRAAWWMIAVFAVCINVAAQLGDLVESALKRGAGIKDSGALLPGHGGVLDRIDALLFAVPTGWLFYVSGYSAYFTARGILIS